MWDTCGTRRDISSSYCARRTRPLTYSTYAPPLSAATFTHAFHRALRCRCPPQARACWLYTSAVLNICSYAQAVLYTLPHCVNRPFLSLRPSPHALPPLSSLCGVQTVARRRAVAPRAACGFPKGKSHCLCRASVTTCFAATLLLVGSFCVCLVTLIGTATADENALLAPYGFTVPLLCPYL